jgi:glycosyltransferase involved in cell wall biosynthesis
MSKRNFISVVMPVYNNSEFLSKAIQSILNQTFKNFELIILDDGSEEDVEAIISDFNDTRIRFYKNDRNIGLTKSLNICLDLTKGDFIARHDSDDIVVKTKLEKQFKAFSAGVGLVGCWGRNVDTLYTTKKHVWFDKDIRVEDDFVKKNITTGNYIIGAGVVIRKGVFNKIGYYDEEIVTGQDYNMWLRILEHYDFRIVKEDLYYAMDNPRSVRRMHNYTGDWVIKTCNELAKKRPFIKNRDKQIWEKYFEKN